MSGTSDEHMVLDGARWHYPAQGDPTRCAVGGCTRVLTPRSNDELDDEFGGDEDLEPG